MGLYPDGYLSPTCVSTAICGVFLGVLLCLWGYRLFRLTLALVATLGTFVGSYLLLNALSVWMQEHPWTNVIISGVVGLVALIIIVVRYRVGIYVLGAVLGAILGVAFFEGVLSELVLSDEHVDSEPLWFQVLEWVLVASSAVVFGFIALMWERIVFIVSTSVIGGFLLVGSVEFIAGLSPNNGECFTLVKEFFADTAVQVRHSWVGVTLIAGWIVAAAVGIVIQFLFTAPKEGLSQVEVQLIEEEVQPRVMIINSIVEPES